MYVKPENIFLKVKKERIKMKEKKGLKVLVSSLFAASMFLPTFCVEGKLNAAANLVYTIAKWGGGIIAFAGLALIGKAFMDSTSGQSQPGQLGKGLGLLVLGVILVVGQAAISSITG